MKPTRRDQLPVIFSGILGAHLYPHGQPLEGFREGVVERDVDAWLDGDDVSFHQSTTGGLALAEVVE